MGKYLLLILIIVVVWWLAKGFRRNDGIADTHEGEPEQMVNCARCGLYLPQGEAIRAGNRFYCCAEHRRLDD